MKIRRTPLLILLLLPLFSAIQAQTSESIGDIRFTTQPVEEGNTSYGYFNGRAVLKNTSDETRTVTIALGDSSAGTFAIERTISIAPLAVINVSLPCPPRNRGGITCFSVKVAETGKEKNNIWIKTNSSSHSLNHYGSSGYNFVVLTPLDADIFISRLKPKITTTLSTKGKKLPSPSSTPWDQSSSQKWEHGINHLSKIWQGLARFDGIVLTDKILNGATPTMQQTLSEYLLSGGTLIIFGSTSNPLSIKPTLTVEQSGAISLLRYGFGHLVLLKDESAKSLSPACSKKIADLIERYPFPSSRLQPAAVHKQLLVVPNITIPLRSTFLLMLVFSILAGPVLIIVLRRKNQRIWLNWTIPALSIVTSTILVIYALVSEGVTASVRLSGVTHLNQIDHMAATLGTHGYYSPFIPARGLEFSPSSSIIKFIKFSYRSSAGYKRIDWTHGQNFVHGWIAARVPEYFSCRTVERRRERIQFTKGEAENSLHIVNGLGADIETLTVVDHSGKIYKTANLKAGAAIEIKAGPKEKMSRGSKLPSLLSNSLWNADLKSSHGRPEIQLHPGTYLAKLNAAPFMENGLSYKKCTVKANSIIHGVWELSDDR